MLVFLIVIIDANKKKKTITALHLHNRFYEVRDETRAKLVTWENLKWKFDWKYKKINLTGFWLDVQSNMELTYEQCNLNPDPRFIIIFFKKVVGRKVI
jgi:hypothetical protein